MEYPLQTRCAYLTPDQMTSASRMERTLEEFVSRSYNAVVVPVLYDGYATFRLDSTGGIDEDSSEGCEALEILRNYPLTVWLSIDLLTAGTPGSGELSQLASRNRPWLMRNIEGRYTPPDDPDVPALFSWTSLDFRRYLGDLLVEITEGYPIDGIVFDLRHVPRTTPDPYTWMFMGFPCLYRIQRELGISLEAFLTEPTMEAYQTIENWRYGQLFGLLENLKARAEKVRRGIPFFLLGRIGKPEDPYVPWAESVDEGLVDELIIAADAEELPRHIEALERHLEETRAFLVAIETETSLADLARSLEEIPATGFCVMRPGPLQRVVMPEASLVWSNPGAIEGNPIQAATEIVLHLAEIYKHKDSLSELIQRLEEFLTNVGDVIRYEDAQNLQQEILATLYKIRDGEVDVPPGNKGVLRQLDLVARLLLLTPIPAIGF